MYIHTNKWLEWLLYVHPHKQMAGVVALCTSTQTNGWSSCFMYINTNKWLEYKENWDHVSHVSGDHVSHVSGDHISHVSGDHSCFYFIKGFNTY